ncbi:MAG: glycosyltransferase [Planctomycetaceae bacterium]|nr:glycosyltransferase [Planctomycetaceae bacterium]
MSETISIIVPVYNTEKYLKRCVDSILNQVYNDLEILLIDDGSTDGSGAICDQYAEQDKRVRAIHTPNGGVAAARNTGLDAATGEYVSFIDSDDWITSDMYVLLHKLFQEYKPDLITLCKAVIATEEGFPVPFTCPSRPIYLQGPYPAIDFWKEYLDQEPLLTMVVWGKLCRRSFFGDRRFAVGQFYEDTLFLPEFYLACKTILCLPGNYYYYFQRPDSLIHEPLTPEKYCQFFDSRLHKINTFYDRGLVDLPYTFDCVLIQGLLKLFEYAYWRLDEDGRRKWLREFDKRYIWFTDQKWTTQNGRTKWERTRRGYW